MSLWDNVKKFAQPYSDDDYDDYDEDEEYEEYEEPKQSARRSRRQRVLRQLRNPGAQHEQTRLQAGGCSVPPHQL